MKLLLNNISNKSMQEYKVIITNNLSSRIDYLLQITQKYQFIKIFVCKYDTMYRVICSNIDNFDEFIENFNYIDITKEFL